MELSEDLLCVFTAQLEEQRDSYVIEIPTQELTVGEVDRGEAYCVAVVSVENTIAEERSPEPTPSDGPPVEEGERRTFDIEGTGEQGDGIARTPQGYVIIVPDTEQGDRVTVEITDVTDTVGFGEVVERKPYYE